MQIVTEMYANPHMVGQGRLELPTPGLGNQCSVQLSYCPAAVNMIPNIRFTG